MNSRSLAECILESEGPQTFDNMAIEGLVLSRGKVTQPVVFRNCRLIGMVLADIDFEKHVLFDNCAFENTFSVSRCEFRDGLSMVSCNMVYTRMEGTTVHRMLELNGSRFTQMFDIKGCTMDNLDFTGAIVLESFNMVGATLKGGVCFNRSTVNGRLTETFTNDWKKARKMLVRNNDVSGLAEVRSILEKEMKYSRSDSIFIAQKRKEREDMGAFRGVMSDISYIMGGYGMKPQYTMAIMLAIILLFAVVFNVMGPEGGLDPEMKSWGCLFASVDSFFSVGRADLPEELVSARAVGLVEGVIGVFLMFYFTVLLTRKIIR